MNSWSHDSYNTEMNQIIPPLVPPMCLMPHNMNIPPMNPSPNAHVPFIGPVDMNIENEELTNDSNSHGQDVQTNQSVDVSSTQNPKRRSREHSSYNSRRDKDRSASGRRRSRSRERRDRYGRNDRNDRNRHDRHRNDDRDRQSKWENTDAGEGQGVILGNNMGNVNMGIMPGMNMMQYPNMINNMMGQQSIDGSQMQMVSNMNMMGSMMPNMMDQNMMMMNQQMMPAMMANQQMFISKGVLLPPIPGVSLRQRRDKPKGCRTIFVGGLPSNVSHDTLNEMFQRFGTIQEIKSPKTGVYYVRFERQESVETSFLLTGFRFKYHDQNENEATTIVIDYAMNRDDQNEFEKNQRKREPTPPRVEPFTATALSNITEKIKSETEFSTAAYTLAVWLERGECSKKNANAFYSLIQASNNQIRRLFNEKMQLDEEFLNMKNTIKDKFSNVVMQFEQVAKILSAAKHQRVSDHFTKQQRRNVEMWLKMTEEVENIKDEFNAIFEDEEVEKFGKNVVPMERYEELKRENENLTYELEGYKNEAHLAKDEAERKFEKFKAHFIAQQALQNKQVYPPLPSHHNVEPTLITPAKPLPPPPTPDDDKIVVTGPSVPPSEAKLISILTAFLMVHPLGASLDYLVSYVRSMTPNVTQATVLATLQKYVDIFHCKTTGVGACIEHRWSFITFETIKQEM
ncbi:ecto-NOX disulfide-thiol exchanger 2-like [Nymphalis io]|uniref:ecto-NOX disulfide-thiol exchanger 2-like n=1 Tax=Inachis io TaxID=171585 RepID=UPI00216A685D|nr:ecto-NOX disulfide-thiol exchanger 2-like [Nymphalis io]